MSLSLFRGKFAVRCEYARQVGIVARLADPQDLALQVIGALLVIGRTNPALLAVAAGVVPLLARAMRIVVVRTARMAYRQRNAASDALSFANERLTQVRHLCTLSRLHLLRFISAWPRPMSTLPWHQFTRHVSPQVHASLS